MDTFLECSVYYGLELVQSASGAGCNYDTMFHALCVDAAIAGGGAATAKDDVAAVAEDDTAAEDGTGGLAGAPLQDTALRLQISSALLPRALELVPDLGGAHALEPLP
eukprot:4655721-Pleurochrysis_carterae.AAC.3